MRRWYPELPEVNRKLLADLRRCAWESLKIFLREAVPENDPVPGAVIAVQTFGNFLGFNPHTHILVTDGCFYGNKGMFRVAPPLELKKLEAILMVRYYGWYSNVSRGKRQKESSDDAVPCILEPRGDVKAFRKSWARLIQKIYEADPLICPKCQGKMRVIGSIEDPSVIRAILEHLGLWLCRSRRLPKSTTRQTPNTPLRIFKSNHTLTLSTATRNTPGMITSRHDAS
jgi:hypothetical protein